MILQLHHIFGLHALCERAFCENSVAKVSCDAGKLVAGRVGDDSKEEVRKSFVQKIPTTHVVQFSLW